MNPVRNLAPLLAAPILLVAACSNNSNSTESASPDDSCAPRVRFDGTTYTDHNRDAPTTARKGARIGTAQAVGCNDGDAGQEPGGDASDVLTVYEVVGVDPSVSVMVEPVYGLVDASR